MSSLQQSSSGDLSSGQPQDPLFPLGHCEVTPAAHAALADEGINPLSLFQRHGSGDWGEVPGWAHRANAEAILQGPSVHAIQSCYRLGDGPEVLLVTATDRTRTLMLLASEYKELEVTSREGYALWSATYDAVPNPLIAVEQPVVDALLQRLLPLKTAVDVGTGTGRLALNPARRGVKVIGLDPSPEMLRAARRTAQAAGLLDIEFIEASLEDGPIPAGSEQFDLLTCALVLCHVRDIRAAVRECARLVRPGGHLLLTDFHPQAVAWGWRTAFVEPGVRYWLPNPGHSRDDYLQALSAADCALLDVQDLALGGEPYGDSRTEAVNKRGAPPLCLTLLARKKPDVVEAPAGASIGKNGEQN